MIDELIQEGPDLFKRHLCEECGYGTRRKVCVDAFMVDVWCPMCRDSKVFLVIRSPQIMSKKFVRFAA